HVTKQGVRRGDIRVVSCCDYHLAPGILSIEFLQLLRKAGESCLGSHFVECVNQYTHLAVAISLAEKAAAPDTVNDSVAANICSASGLPDAAMFTAFNTTGMSTSCPCSPSRQRISAIRCKSVVFPDPASPTIM